jgi:multidrug efflux pump
VNLVRLAILRPVATTLLSFGVALAGVLGYIQLPVSPLPQVDLPVIYVQAPLPGASPETMATAVAEPLEKHLSQISDVDEITSQSTLGSTFIVLQFGLDRNIDGAARDVQAAINAAHADLPTQMRQNPFYRKANPADAPILLIALTSNTRTRGQLYDDASNVLQQGISQLDGIGEVDVVGAALPAVRVELNPQALSQYGIGLETVRAALASANANAPKGAIIDGGRRLQIYTNDQALHADDYKPLIIAYRNGAPVRLTDVAEVVDSVQDLRNMAFANGKPAVLLIVRREPGANIIQAVDNVLAALPRLKASLPADTDVSVISDRSTAIRISLADTQQTLLIAVALVVLVVFAFLRNLRVTLIPSIVVPISLIGTFALMNLCGYSLNNLTLMALTIATGFVVDDAIVVLENIVRHVEAGMPRMQAALLGAQEIGFTIVSISLSLVAVFLPIILMGGVIGRFFREFAMTMSLAIMLSMVLSLTLTPMMCARLLAARSDTPAKGLHRTAEHIFDKLLASYARSLGFALSHPLPVILVLFAMIGLNFYLFISIPKGFFPEQDNGRIFGSLVADQSISFQAMRNKLAQMMAIVQSDPAVAGLTGYTGGRQLNTAQVFISLKPINVRKVRVEAVIARLRKKLATVSGAHLYLQAIQEARFGGRLSNAEYQYTLQSESADDLFTWAPRLVDALQNNPIVADVSSDAQQNGLSMRVEVDRQTAARYGVLPSLVDQNLYDAFGQRQVSTIYKAINQYFVIMEVAPPYWQDPEILRRFYISTASGTFPNGTALTNAVIGTVTNPSGNIVASPLFAPDSQNFAAQSATTALNNVRNLQTNAIANTGKSVGSTGAAVSTVAEREVPLAAVARFVPGKTPLVVNHQGQFVAVTISFNLRPGRALSDAAVAIQEAAQRIGMPPSIRGSFQGTARFFVASVKDEPILILAALATMYIVLGILYESYVHPITILSTLPSAGVGALLALMAFGEHLTIIAMIGLILLIGIVKKNAILMIDFALAAERERGLSPREAIHEACLKRFRPILMTTFAAAFGALPLVIGTDVGSEIRRPLGISIVGGLSVSQVLTLYTTPVVYLYLDRLRLWAEQQWHRLFPGLSISNLPKAGE